MVSGLSPFVNYSMVILAEEEKSAYNIAIGA